jgi:hypothetical protein
MDSVSPKDEIWFMRVTITFQTQSTYCKHWALNGWSLLSYRSCCTTSLQLLQHQAPTGSTDAPLRSQISYLTAEAVYVLRNNEMLPCNHCYSGTAISTTRSEYVFVALVIQHATRIRRIGLSSVARPALPYFSALSHKRPPPPEGIPTLT